MSEQPAQGCAVSLEEIAQLLELVSASQFDEVEIEWDDVKVRVRLVPSNARAQGAGHQSRSSRSKV